MWRKKKEEEKSSENKKQNMYSTANMRRHTNRKAEHGTVFYTGSSDFNDNQNTSSPLRHHDNQTGEQRGEGGWGLAYNS